MLNSPRTILITGGTSGIGASLVRQLNDQGHHIVTIARDTAKLEHLTNQYPGLHGYPCDLASRQQVEELCTKILEKHADISVVINNAGVQYTPTFLDTGFHFDAIEHETRINFLAPVWLSCLLLPALINQDRTCAIVNISSGLALAPKTSSAVYCATKAAIHSFSQSLRYQLDGSNVRVMEVILPLVDTPMTAGRGQRKLPPDEAASRIMRGIQSGKDEIYVGIARVLPLLMRVSPSIAKTLLRKH